MTQEQISSRCAEHVNLVTMTETGQAGPLKPPIEDIGTS